MTLTNIAIFIFSLCGFTALALAMPRHNRQLLHKVLPLRSRRLIRFAGWAFLVLALGLGMTTFNFDVGTVAWLGWLSIAGLTLTLCLPYGPWQKAHVVKLPSTKKYVGWVERSDKFAWNKFGQLRWPSGRGADAPSHTQQAMVRRDSRVGYRYRSTQPTENQAVSNPRRYAGLAVVALLVPLASFAWQLFSTPVKPLLRDDAIHGEIGPWTFSLAEKDQAPPELVAMDVPLKEFVIRFCESCDTDIRMAYLKVRQPRSPRAAGNGFEGRGREKTATIPLPAAATLDDGFWLTVEGKDGKQYSQEFAIQSLSPATATFIGERL